MRFFISFLLIFLTLSPAVAGDLASGLDGRQREIDQAVVGDTAVLLERGDLEVTFGVSFKGQGDQETVELFVGLEYGLTDRLEVGLQVPYLFLYPKPDDKENLDGLGDLTLSFSLALFAKAPFLASASLGISLPTGDEKKSDDLGEGVEQWKPSLAVNVALGQAELVLDVGGEFANHIAVFVYGVTLAYPIDEVVVSLGVEGSLDGDEKEVLLVPGIGFPLSKDVELGIEVPIGLTGVSSDWKVGIEVTFEF